jgi:ABC-type antimicrobial peptide transport system permease subunit
LRRKEVAIFLNFIKIALRNIRKHKGYTFINVAGLAVSIACCMLIGLWILNEMSYDKHFADVDRIYALQTEEDNLISPNALAPFLMESIPEIQHVARVDHEKEILISTRSHHSFEKILPADPAIIDVFSFPFIVGDPRTALNEPNSIIITQDMALKFYPNQTAIGKTLTFNNQTDYTITGIIDDIPHNSSLQFDMMVSIDIQRQMFSEDGLKYDGWNLATTTTYLKMRPGIIAADLTEKISGVIKDREAEEELSISAVSIGDVYFRFSEAKKGIKIFSAIVLAILVMASFNFINLSTARFKTRGKETGIRKVIGARRGNLILQFLGESALLVTIGFAFAVGIVEMVLPLFNSLFQLKLSFDLFNNYLVILAIIGIIGITALASGIYPALFLSRYNPVQALKDNFGSTKKNFNLRRILVVVQFSLTAILIIGTVIVYSQINHMKSLDVGYNKAHIINIPLRGESRNHFSALKTELLQNSAILSVSGAMGSLPYWNASTTARWDGMDSDEGEKVHMNFVGYDYTKTFGIEMIEGRDFDESYATDVQSGCIINESLARLMNQSPILGCKIDIWGDGHQVIGVMKDFNFRPLNFPIKPLAIMMVPESGFMFMSINSISVRINGNNIESALGHIEKTWNQVIPTHPFEYSFLDEQFDGKYKSLDQMSSLAACFGLLAAFIAGLGLFGLASFTAEQRTREIGIRKVLGASINSIVRLLSKEFVLLVGISNLVAWPLAWYMMNHWLGEFAYHVKVSIGSFIAVGCFVLIVALFSVGYQALRAAYTNPVDTMKYY